MKEKDISYYENPYVDDNGFEGRERMSIVRSAMWISIAIVISTILAVIYGYHKERYQIIPLQSGVYIFDRKTTTLNYCDGKKCTMVSGEFIRPRLAPPLVMMPQMPQQMNMQQQIMPQQQNPLAGQQVANTFANAQMTQNQASAPKPATKPVATAPATPAEPAAEDTSTSSEDTTAAEDTSATDTTTAGTEDTTAPAE